MSKSYRLVAFIRLALEILTEYLKCTHFNNRALGVKVIHSDNLLDASINVVSALSKDLREVEKAGQRHKKRSDVS